MTEINLHLAGPAHIEGIARLRADARGSMPANKQDIARVRESISAPGHLWLVALRGDEIVGYAAAVPISSTLSEIDGVHISRRFRGGGIGSSMLAEAFRILQARGVAAVAIAASDRTAGALSRLGVQMLPAAHSLGLATADGAFASVSGRAGRWHMGVGFLTQSTRAAIAWPIAGVSTPTPSEVAESFVSAFAGSQRQEVVDVLGDSGIIKALMALGRIDLVTTWTAPFAPTA